MKHAPPTTVIHCRECGEPMEYLWSQGTWDEGTWVIACRNVARLGQPGTCFMAGETFSPDRYTPERFAERRAMRVLRRAHAGIINRNPDGTVAQWLAEAVERGILPADWATTFQGTAKAG